MRSMVSYRLVLLVGVLSVSIFSLNTFVLLPAALVSNQPQQLLQSAFATFPWENGKIAFNRYIDDNWEIYVMNADGTNVQRLTNNTALDSTASWSPDGTRIAFHTLRDRQGEIYAMNVDGSGQTRLTNNPASDHDADWGTAPNDEVEDTTAPVLTVPDDITAQATTANGGTVVTYDVIAEDSVDGTAILEEDNTITQDDIGGDINISCEPPSGYVFSIDDTEVQCTATDVAGNVGGPESFTVTVNAPPPPAPPTPTTPRELLEELISDIENIVGISDGTKACCTLGKGISAPI